MKLLALSGSLRAASTNSALLRAMARCAPAGVDVSAYERLGSLPIFNPDDQEDRMPEPVAALVSLVTQADGLIVACPEYAHGIPGGFKNALDWLVSNPHAVGKPAMLVHASARSLFARSALREIMTTMSFALFDGTELEIGLLGKDEASVAATLDGAPARQAMTDILVSFSKFIAR